MSKLADSVADARQSPRLKLPAMYTLVRVKPTGEDRYRWTGHIYDISETGMRFELDNALQPGMTIEIRAMLPGTEHITFSAAGRIIRIHNDMGDKGPMRMGMIFDKFSRENDHERLNGYLSHSPALAA